MRIAIIGGGWSGIYTAYQLKQIYKNKHDIVIFEKEKTIGGKCKDLMNKYPGGAIQFPYYKHFGKVLEENNFKLVQKYYTNINDVNKFSLLTFLAKLQFYRLQSKYDNIQVCELFSHKELNNLKYIIENYGYKEMTMHYLYQYIDSFLNKRVCFDLLKIKYVSMPHFLDTSIYKLMLEISKDIKIITDCEIKSITKISELYTIHSESIDYKNFDIIIFTNVVNSSFDNIIPRNIIKECEKLTYTKYATALLNKTEIETLKNDMIFSINIKDDEEYKIGYFYDIEKLSSIPDDRKNIVDNYFPRFKEAQKSQSLINSYQGKDRLFYTGGYLSFELIERICFHIQNTVIPEIKTTIDLEEKKK